MPRTTALIPDGQNGMIISGVDYASTANSGPPQLRPWTYRYRSGDVLDWGLGVAASPVLVSRDDTVYYAGNDGLHASSSAGASKWSAPLLDGEVPLQALAGEGVRLYNQVTGALARLGDTGARDVPDQLPPMSRPFSSAVDEVVGQLVDQNGLSLGIVKYPLSPFNDNTAVPNAQGQNASAPKQETGVFIRAYEVIQHTGIGHIGLMVIPTNQAYWLTGPLTTAIQFRHKINGRWLFTVGGEASQLPCGGQLLAKFNRKEDIWNKAEVVRERLNVPGEDENAKIQLIIAHKINYGDNLAYACTPNIPVPDDAYNSNSLAHGLINAAGIPVPSYPTNSGGPIVFPGWSKPVPDLPEFFGPVITGEWR